MTIYEVSKRLNECANGKCSTCDYLYISDPEKCKTLLIESMGKEVEKIGNAMRDDMK